VEASASSARLVSTRQRGSYGTTNAVVTTVPVGSGPSGVAVNPSPSIDRVYVANGFGSSVTVLNGNSSSVVATIPLAGGYPFAVAFNPNTNRVYVTNTGPNTLVVIDGNGNDVVATAPVGIDPFGVAINLGASRIYS